MATATQQYIGNNDFRGYVNYLASNTADPVQAAGYKNLLGVIGNDGKVNGTNFQGLDTPFGYSAGTNAAGKVQGDVTNLYNNWQNNVLGASDTNGTGADNTDASDLAYLDDQDSSLKGQLTSAQTGLSQGLQQLDDSYNESVGRTNQDQSSADTGFNTNRTQTTQDKLGAIDTANSNSNTLASSVRRILGLAAGSNSSAFQVAAPKLLATDLTAKRQGINDTFTRNYGAIDSAQTASDTKFERALQDLSDQKKQKESGLQSGIDQQVQSINQQLGQNALSRAQINGAGYAGTKAAIAPYSQAISDRQSAIDNLFSTYRTPYTLADTTPVAANTSSYTVDPTTLGTTATDTSGGDGTDSPYLQALLKKFQTGATATA